MAFDIRCPECKAKLRLDEAPDSDTPIECPRCGSQFAAPDDAKPARKSTKKEKSAKSKGGEKPKSGSPKKRKAIKKKVNPFLLLLMIGGAFAGLIGVGAALIYFANKAGNVEEMLTYVPESCNMARGVNVGTLSKYPGYATEQDKFLTPDVKWTVDEFATAAGHNLDGFLSYFVIARSRPDNTNISTMYVFRTMKSFKPQDLGANLKGARENSDGSYTITGGTGLLKDAMIHMPTNRVIVLVPPGGQQRQLMTGSLAGKNGKEGTFAGHLDTTGRVVIRGAIWFLARQTGGLKNYAADSVSGVKEGLKTIYDRAAKSTGCFGVWSTPGGNGVRFGVAMQCESTKDASDLVRAMQEGPLGKGDESEPTNDMRSGFSVSSDKKLWGEMMQSLEYRSKRECAYIVATVTGEHSKRILGMVNSPTMGTGAAGGGTGGGGAAPPPGSGFGPPAGGPQAGPPGGIAPPGGINPGGR